MSGLAASSSGWPVLLCAGLLLGLITLCSTRQRAHLLWFLPTMLLTAIGFLLVTGEAANVLILAPERLGIGVIAVLPSVVCAFFAAWCALRLGAANWMLVGAPAMACLVTTPLAGYLARAAVCELVGECP